MRILFIIREINRTIAIANEIKAKGGKGPAFTWYLTNKSFVSAVVGVVLALVGTVYPVALGVPPDAVASAVAAVGTLAAFAFSLFQRATGKTVAVWNTKQANDALTAALSEAIASKDK